MIEKTRFLHKETFTKAGNIFFDELLAMMTSLTSVIFSAELARAKTSGMLSVPNHQLKDAIVIPYQGLAVNLLYVYEAYEPLLKLSDNQPVDSISFLIHENGPAPSATVYRVALPWRLDEAIMGAFYISFYEKQLDSIRAKFSSDPNTWPSDLNFARVIRNAYAHGGGIHFINPQAASVSWMGITYSPSDNGNSIYTQIALPEIIELMKVIESHLI